MAQYTNDRNLAARQRLWQHQQPPFDLVAWVLGVARVEHGERVLDVGCGNGHYLHALRARGIDAVGCDLSLGMLRSAAPHPELVQADVVALPFPEAAFDVVLAPHMLYHVVQRVAAVRELRRVLRPGGLCVAVTNGARHLRSLRRLVEDAVRREVPSWEVHNLSQGFSLENGAEPLATAFTSVTCLRPETDAPVVVRDPAVAADYVASLADPYEAQIGRPWMPVVEYVRVEVQRVIDRDGAFITEGDPGAFLCR